MGVIDCDEMKTQEGYFFQNGNRFVGLRAYIFKNTEDGNKPFETFIIDYLRDNMYKFIFTEDDTFTVLDIKRKNGRTRWGMMSVNATGVEGQPIVGWDESDTRLESIPSD